MTCFIETCHVCQVLSMIVENFVEKYFVKRIATIKQNFKNNTEQMREKHNHNKVKNHAKKEKTMKPVL